jgi:hypothetical protein
MQATSLGATGAGSVQRSTLQSAPPAVQAPARAHAVEPDKGPEPEPIGVEGLEDSEKKKRCKEEEVQAQRFQAILKCIGGVEGLGQHGERAALRDDPRGWRHGELYFKGTGTVTKFLVVPAADQVSGRSGPH